MVAKWASAREWQIFSVTQLADVPQKSEAPGQIEHIQIPSLVPHNATLATGRCPITLQCAIAAPHLHAHILFLVLVKSVREFRPCSSVSSVTGWPRSVIL